MIKRIDITKKEQAVRVLQVQLLSYKIEASLIGSSDIPPLHDTAYSLQYCGETFYGYWEVEKLCGVISMKVENDELDIHRLVVHPDHFKKGIAQKLLSFIEQQYPVPLIKVATASLNLPAIQLYRKNGFEKVREEKVSTGLSLSFFEKQHQCFF